MTQTACHPSTDDGACADGGFAARLPKLSAAAAAAARLAFDARFERWLRTTIGEPGLQVLAGGHASPLALSVRSEADPHCCALLALSAASWPALQAAADLPDEHTANAVLSVLLKPLLDKIAPAQGPMSVARLTGPRSAAVATFATPAGEVALLGCAPGLARHIQSQLPPCSAQELAPLAGLKLRGSVRVLERRWPLPVLTDLSAGDLVLSDAPAGQALRWRVGIGRTLQAAAELDLQRQVLHMTETPTPAAEPETQTEEAPPAAWSGLQLPVSFELDTARVSLAELAAMRAGCSIALDQPLLAATVRLVCHGQTLGEGQLVAIGDHLGVRITRMTPVPDDHGLS